MARRSGATLPTVLFTGDGVESIALYPTPGWETRHVVFAPTIPDAARSIALRLARMAAGRVIRGVGEAGPRRTRALVERLRKG